MPSAASVLASPSANTSALRRECMTITGLHCQVIIDHLPTSKRHQMAEVAAAEPDAILSHYGLSRGVAGVTVTMIFDA